MSATITWSIEWMNCKPTEGSYTDVVVNAGWGCNGVQVDADKTYTGSVNGICAFAMPTGSFTPYDQLTEEQVLSWCWASGANKAEVEAAVQAQIDSQFNPPIVALPLPWLPPTE